MAEVFTRTPVDFGGAMTAEVGLLVPTGGFTGFMCQNIGLQYAQSVNRIYEIGHSGAKTNVYYVGGRANGNLSVSHIVGPGVSLKTFHRNYSDVCRARENNLTLDLSPNVCGSNSAAPVEAVRYTAKLCVLQALSVAVAATDFLVQTSSTIMFSGLTDD